jgi:HPt (histidine-containing phosphotransfer) domain-containing protein
MPATASGAAGPVGRQPFAGTPALPGRSHLTAQYFRGKDMHDINHIEAPLVSRDVLDSLELEIQDSTAYVAYVSRNMEMWPARYQRLADAILQRDGATSMNAMVSLRSAGQMVGAVKLADIALRMEGALQNGKFDVAEALLPELRSCGLETLDQLGEQFTITNPLSFDESDWRVLVGQRIEVRFPNGDIDTGTVDAVTMDGEILWLQQDGALPRRLIEKADGLGVRSLVLSRAKESKIAPFAASSAPGPGTLAMAGRPPTRSEPVAEPEAPGRWRP